MTSTPCQSAALDRTIAPWAVKIAAFFAIIVETIVMIAENISSSLHELGALLPEDRRLLAPCPGLSRPMMPKLGFLPLSVSVLHALARRRSPEFERSVTMNLRGESEAQDRSQDEGPAEADGGKAHGSRKALRQRIERGIERV